MASKITQVQTSDRVLGAIQDNITKAVNPVLQNPLCFGNIATSVSLAVGSNSINHNLGTKLQGWVIVRKRGSADIYDTQDTNANASTTLALTSDTAVVVDIYFF